VNTDFEVLVRRHVPAYLLPIKSFENGKDTRPPASLSNPQRSIVLRAAAFDPIHDFMAQSSQTRNDSGRHSKVRRVSHILDSRLAILHDSTRAGSMIIDGRIRIDRNGCYSAQNTPSRSITSSARQQRRRRFFLHQLRVINLACDVVQNHDQVIQALVLKPRNCSLNVACRSLF